MARLNKHLIESRLNMESEENSKVERVTKAVQILPLQNPSKLGMIRDGLLMGSLLSFLRGKRAKLSLSLDTSNKLSLVYKAAGFG